MDAKSLAKSKRAHTQHLNKKHHPKPTSKAASAGVGVGGSSSQKPNVKQFKGSKKLPSNWDRYEDEDDLDSEVSGQGSKTDVNLPKSKGADYGYLISEAKAQAESSYPSFDDVFSDYRQEVGSLLSVRGENILSWASEDDFLSEDKATGVQEASFLSIDLNALAKQLAKVDLSERLFIEADLLPLELCSEELQRSRDHKPCTSEIPVISEITKTSSELSNGANQFDWDIEVQGTSDLDHPVKSETLVSKSRSDESLMPESKRQPDSQLGNEPASVQNKSHSGFKAADAEAELDMLLDSFSEPNVPQSTLLKEDPRYSTSTIFSEKTTYDQLVSTRVKSSLDQSSSASTLDDSLDDLLKETSNRINQDIVSRSNIVKTAPRDVHSSSSGPTKSELLDDFDSWLDTI